MISEIVLNEPLNPNGGTTYCVGHRLGGHRANEDEVESITRTRVTGEMAYIDLYTVTFQNGVTRTIYQHGVQSVQETPDAL